MCFKERRAIFVYEGARIHAVALNCPVIPAVWGEREADFKQQFVELIDNLCSGKRKFKDFKEAHDSWMVKYFDMGWKYGKVYDPVNRIHPDLVEYEDLDPKEKVKDEVFVRLVTIARDCIWDGFSGCDGLPHEGSFLAGILDVDGGKLRDENKELRRQNECLQHNLTQVRADQEEMKKLIDLFNDWNLIKDNVVEALEAVVSIQTYNADHSVITQAGVFRMPSAIKKAEAALKAIRGE